MVNVDPELLDNLERHQESLTAKELVRYLERHHPVEGSGVPRELVEAYATDLDYDLDRLRTALDDRLTGSRTWQPGERLYEVDDNVSVYPAAWHEELAGSTDLSKYVEVMLESVKAPKGVEVDRDKLGISQDELKTAAEIIGELDRSTIKRLLKDQRVAGDIVLYAFQNPEEIVRLPEEDGRDEL